jgi:hypothetical protein
MGWWWHSLDMTSWAAFCLSRRVIAERIRQMQEKYHSVGSQKTLARAAAIIENEESGDVEHWLALAMTHAVERQEECIIPTEQVPVDCTITKQRSAEASLLSDLLWLTQQ